MKNNKVVWIELLRIISIFSIIILHVASKGVFDIQKLYTPGWEWLNIFHSISKFAVGCFVMISGSLFLDEKRTVTISMMIRKYISKLLVLFLFWSAIYTISSTIVNSYIRGEEISALKIIVNFFEGYVHLWFIYMLIGLYLITPILREIIKNKKITEYFLCIIVLFGFIPNMFCVIPQFQAVVNNILENKMYFYFPMGYIGYYVLGYYLNNYIISGKQKKIIYVLGIMSTIYSFVISTILSYRQGEVVVSPYLNTTLNVMLMSAAVFVLFKYDISKRKLLERKGKQICDLGSCTLGVYVIHVAFVEIFSAKIIYWFNYKYLFIVVPMLSMIIFMICMCITLLIKKIPVIKDWIV